MTNDERMQRESNLIATSAQARGVPWSMSRIRSEFLNADPSSRSLTANVLVREEPDDEEDEEDNGDEEDDDEDKEDNEGYSQ